MAQNLLDTMKQWFLKRRQAKKNLRLVSFALEQLSDAVHWIDLNARIVDVNEAACRMLGYTRDELLQLTIPDIDPEFSITRFNNTWNSFTETTHLTFETGHRTKEGHIIPLEVMGSFIEFEGQALLCTFARDIRERKLAENKLRESEERYRQLFELESDALFLIDNETGHILEANSAATELYGYSHEELLNKKNSDLSAEPEDTQRVTQTTPSLDQIVTVPLRFHHKKDGTVFPVEITGRFFVQEGRSVHIAAIRDITQRRQAEEEIRQLNEQLEQRVIHRTSQLETANKELEAFAYSVSHDLRAPLRAIDGYTRILFEDYEPFLDEEGKRVCSVIQKESQRMGQLIDDLLAYSRLSRTEIQFVAINMADLVDSIICELVTTEEQERIDLIIDSLPVAIGDPLLIHQVWTNLISNALKFSSKRERAMIHVGSQEDDENHIYFVQDNGVGFDTQYANKLFGVFQRLHNEREFEGNGVGLAIVERVIHRHHGKVWAEGKIDRGATFYFSLPIKELNYDGV